MRDVQTTLNYYQRSDEPCYYYVTREPPPGVPANNISNDARTAIIHDARGKEDDFRLDISGFQWVNHASSEKAFDDKEKIKSVCYPEVEEILEKHVSGAKRVFIFNHTIRKGSELQREAARVKGHSPVHFVHCDHTSQGAEEKVRQRLPEDAEKLLQERYQIVNVWPIAHPVAHYPLGVVDFRTVDVEADMIPLRLVFSSSEAGVYNVAYNPGHRWYYLSDQTPDEVLLFKCLDSDVGSAQLAPHSAFPDMTSSPDAPQRQSIEVRALVFDRE